MIRIPICPRCGGKLYFETDPWGSYYQCLYCGGLWDVVLGRRDLTHKADRQYRRYTESEKKRKSRLREPGDKLTPDEAKLLGEALRKMRTEDI